MLDVYKSIGWKNCRKYNPACCHGYCALFERNYNLISQAKYIMMVISGFGCVRSILVLYKRAKSSRAFALGVNNPGIILRTTWRGRQPPHVYCYCIAMTRNVLTIAKANRP